MLDGAAFFRGNHPDHRSTVCHLPGKVAMISRYFAWAALLVTAASAQAAGLEKGTPDIKSAGPLAFGPDGVLFVGDPVGGAIFAIDTGDRAPEPIGPAFYAADVDKKVISLVGDEPRFFTFNDMAINPTSGKAYLSFDRGRVGGSVPGIVRVDKMGKVEAVSLRDVPFAKASLPNPAPPDPRRPGPNDQGLSVTDLAFVDGRLYVAGLSDEEFASRIVPIPYPFPDTIGKGTSIEIFHGASGEFNTTLPIWTFAPCRIKGEPHLLAAYAQTPLVKIPITSLKPGTHFRGTTVAELGNRNNPLDMLVYQKGGKDFVIVTNTRQGLMKISLDWLAEAHPIESRLVGPAGLPHEKIAQLRGVSLIERIDDDHALILGHKPGGLDLFAIPLP
jgi:hypothetical protein